MSPETWDTLERMALAAIVWTFVFWCLWSVVRVSDRKDVKPTEWE